jgi:hypothetical protein
MTLPATLPRTLLPLIEKASEGDAAAASVLGDAIEELWGERPFGLRIMEMENGDLFTLGPFAYTAWAGLRAEPARVPPARRDFGWIRFDGGALLGGWAGSAR